MTAQAVSGAVPDTPASALCTCGCTGRRVRRGRARDGLPRCAPQYECAMAIRWLIMLSAAGVAFLIARGFAAGPAVVTAALGAGTVMCSAVPGSGWLRQHRERISGPGANRA